MLLDNELWVSDIDRVSAVIPELKMLNGKTILVTGGTGLICSAIIDILIRYNEKNNGNITIICAARDLEKVWQRFGRYCEKEYFKFLLYDAMDNQFYLEFNCDYIIHGASNACPAAFTKEPVETMVSNFTGTLNLLKYSKQSGTNRLLYISSSEIYGEKQSLEPISENEYGVIDLLNSRNAYSVGKRAAETLCIAFSEEYDIETVIVRPGHIYGPTASIKDNRVSSMFAYQAARGQNIVLKSDGSQTRSYCYCLDCATAIIKILLLGENKKSYNISNKDSICTIKQMAQILASAGNSKLLQIMPAEEEKKNFNPMMNSSLNSERLYALGWKGCFDAEEGFSHTVKILQEVFRMN